MKLTSAPIRLLKIGAVCERTSLSRSSVYREIDSGRLKSIHIGRSVRVSENDLEAYLEALTISGPGAK